jgi:hypothetical protein
MQKAARRMGIENFTHFMLQIYEFLDIYLQKFA